MNSTHNKLSKEQCLAARREEARREREAAARCQRRNGWLLRAAVVGAALAITLVVTLLVVNQQASVIADQGPRPANTNEFNGVTIGVGGAVVRMAVGDRVNAASVPRPSAQEGISDPAAVGITPSNLGEPVPIVVFVDLRCEYCQAFEVNNAEWMTAKAQAGEITVEFRPFSLSGPDKTSVYSFRAASAASCVADQAPEAYPQFLRAMYENQPEETGPGLSAGQIKQYASQSGAPEAVNQCIDQNTFGPFTKYATASAFAAGLTGTPTIYVDGKQWQSQQKQFQDFPGFVQEIIDSKRS